MTTSITRDEWDQREGEGTHTPKISRVTPRRRQVGKLHAPESSSRKAHPLISVPSRPRNTSLPLLLLLLSCAHGIDVISTANSHFLSGNLSSIEFPMGQGAGSDNSFIVAGVRYDQSAIKTRASTAIKSILQQHFKFTGQETIQPTMDKVETDSNGRWHVRFKQYFDGLPIEGASLLAHIDPVSGMLIGINGEFHSGSSMDPVFRSASNRLSCESAAEIALAEYGAPEGEWQSACTVAIVQGRDGKARRAFKRLFGYQPAGAGDPYQLDQVFADRVSGSLLTVHPQVMGARAINTFDCRRREVGPNDCKLVTSIPEKISYPDKINSRKRAAEDAHNSAVDVYDFFMNYFGRDSYDGKGATIRSYTNYGALFNNAFFSVAFDGIVYGNGDEINYNYFSKSFDVVVHEYTHGITISTSNLAYLGESGALNEAISDIFGATAERLVRRSTKTKVWLIGEKIVRASFKALRNMENPPEYSQPDHYSERYQGDEDNQGVHANSGIISKAFVLMVQGGVHPVSKIDVPPLNPSFDESILEAAKIFYDANTKCLSESSNFLMARQCTLMFASSEQADTVSKAWDAVGVEEQESSTTCKGRGEFCSVRDDCCGKRLTCGGQDDNRTCKKCRRRNQSCTVSESCCEGLKCESSMCVSVRL